MDTRNEITIDKPDQGQSHRIIRLYGVQGPTVTLIAMARCSHDVIAMVTRMAVHDGRGLAASERRRLNVNDFELFSAPLCNPSPNYFAHHQVMRDYYPSCAEIVGEASVASHVVAFDHNVRSVAGKQAKKRIKGGQQVQGPSRMVHGNYTPTSAPQRLRDLTNPPGLNNTVRSVLAEGEPLLDPNVVEGVLGQGRSAIINLWQDIADEPVETHPLALCD